MTNPIITFGIPTYNRPSRLRYLLNSIYSQVETNYSEFEVIISDNSDDEKTKDLISEYYSDKTNLKYLKNIENIGSERNIRQVFDIGTGHFTWLMPDDDFLTTNKSIKTVIDCIKKYDNDSLSFIITNLRSKLLDSEIIYSEKINPINSEIYFEDGRDILNMLNDNDFLGAQRLIVKRGTLPHSFEQKHTISGFVGCMSIALVAASSGAALYISKPVVTFCAGDTSSWRRKVPKIYYFDMSYLLREAAIELGYDSNIINNLIQRKKTDLKPIFNPLYFLFQLHEFKWRPFIDLFGYKFFFWNILFSPINIFLNTKIAKLIFKRKIVL